MQVMMHNAQLHMHRVKRRLRVSGTTDLFIATTVLENNYEKAQHLFLNFILMHLIFIILIVLILKNAEPVENSTKPSAYTKV
jgi:hypothetical protein